MNKRRRKKLSRKMLRPWLWIRAGSRLGRREREGITWMRFGQLRFTDVVESIESAQSDFAEFQRLLIALLVKELDIPYLCSSVASVEKPL
jgi:hypothetical protein